MKRYRRGLGLQMLSAFILVVVVAMLIPALYSLTFVSKRIFVEAQNKMKSDLEIATLLLNNKEETLLRIGKSLSNDIFFGKMVAGRVGESIRVKLRYSLKGFTAQDLTYLTVTDINGKVMFRSRAIYSTGDDRSAVASVRKALNGEESVSYELLDPEEMWRNGLIDEPATGLRKGTGLAVEATLPVYYQERASDIGPDADNYRGIVGTITVGYLVNTDTKLLNTIQKKTGGIANIHIPSGIINSSVESWDGSLPPEIFKNSYSWKRGYAIRDRRKKGEITGYLPLQNTEKRTVGIFEIRTSTEPIQSLTAKALKKNLLILLLGIVVASALSIYLTRQITEPITKLRRGAEEIGRGNLQYRIDIMGEDEISQLAATFNEMTVRLDMTMTEIRDSKWQVEDYSNRLKRAHSDLEMYSQELEKVNQKLLESNISLKNANEVKDTFLSTVSHELRTPLTSIIGYVSMLLEGVLGPMSDEQRESLEVVLRRGKNLQTLIADLLSLSRIDAGKIELHQSYFDPERELKNLEEVFRERLEASDVSLVMELPEKMDPVYADRDRINQVLFNLVGNAIKFSPEGGVITISFNADREQGFVRFLVSDNGIGIPEDALEKVFERFYQVEMHDGREYGGTGLGLAIAKELVELHGGQIHASRGKDKGSAFSFTLPIR